MAESTFGIVGGGILGLAVGRELVRRRPGTRVVVFEKEDRVAVHQTGHNSGVVHAGIYYRPGSLKAQLCTRGRAMIKDYCAEHGLPFDQCGKLVVAVDAAELGRFDALEQTARANGVPGLARVEAAGITDIEPHATGLAALHSPQTAITDFVAIARTIAGEIEAAGGQVRLSTRGDRHRADRWPASRSPPPPAPSVSTASLSAPDSSPTGSGRPGRMPRPGRGSCRSGAST